MSDPIKLRLIGERQVEIKTPPDAYALTSILNIYANDDIGQRCLHTLVRDYNEGRKALVRLNTWHDNPGLTWDEVCKLADSL